MSMLVVENLRAHVPLKVYNINEDQMTSLFDGLQEHMKDFRDLTRQMIAQTETTFMFTLPEIIGSVEELAEDAVFISEGKFLMKEWNGVLLDILEQVMKEKPEKNNLPEEVKFWDAQKIKLALYQDQVSHGVIHQTTQVLKIVNCSVVQEFESNVARVESQLFKVTQIINYFALLEPHTKNILSENESKKSLEEVFVVLKVMWIQSDYFKQVENMGRVLRGFSVLLKEKVKESARIDILFKKPLQKVKKIVTDSSKVLSYWKKLYLEESENVKKYGPAYWWPFDIRHFFDETDYIIIICKDIENVANKLQELHNIFDTNLKYFVENVRELDALKNRIFSMTVIIQYAQFDPFEAKYRAEWKKVMGGFNRDLKSFEHEVKTFLQKMFQNNLSWENAYILSKSFQTVAVSSALKEFIVESRVDMLREFVKEISEIENMFLANERDPPQFGDIPETASAILWIQDLLSKITYPMEKIMEDLSNEEKEVHERFKKTGQLLKSYQQKKYEVWKINAAEKFNKFLHSNILRKLQMESNSAGAQFEDILLYRINFPLYFREVSVEAKFLEIHGYDIPFSIRNVVLQESTFYQYRNKLKIILGDLKYSFDELEDEELTVMGVPISDLIVLIEPGVHHIQWESTKILEFLKNVERGVDIFHGVINQVKKLTSEINSRIKLLSTCDIFQFKKLTAEIPTCESYFNEAQKSMDFKVEKMVQIYRSFEPLLITLERITCKTTTGKSEHLREYYSICEKKILLALVQVMLDNLEYLEEELLELYIFPYIEAAYQSEDEMIRSSFVRLKLVFVIFLQSVTECSRKLLRWLDGSCIMSSPFYSDELKQKLEFSYWLDTSIHPGIKKITLRILQKLFCFVDSTSEQKCTA